jgi:hypothetical protein
MAFSGGRQRLFLPSGYSNTNGVIMRMKWFSLVFFVAFSSPSVAAEKNYKICTAGGYFAGADDKFLSGLATHMAQKKNILNDPICGALWRNAHKIGEIISKTGKIHDEAEGNVVQDATEFSGKVYDVVSSKINF